MPMDKFFTSSSIPAELADMPLSADDEIQRESTGATCGPSRLTMMVIRQFARLYNANALTDTPCGVIMAN